MAASPALQARPIRVLVLPSFYPSEHTPAKGTYFVDQTRAVNEQGVTADVVYVEVRPLRSLLRFGLLSHRFQTVLKIEEGIRILRQKGWNTLSQTWHGGRIWSALTRRLVHQYIKRFGAPDLIHAHNGLWAGHVASTLKDELGIPFVVTEHSTALVLRMLDAAQVAVCREAYSSAAAVISVGETLASRIREMSPKTNVHVIPNVVDTDFFTLPVQERTRVPFTFVSVAHLVERKGFHVLLSAFARAFAGNPAFRLRIGGDGPERARLEAQATELGIASQVELLGRLDREQVRQLMWSGNAFVLASRVETFGVVFVEALATGIPAIATDSGGPGDFISSATGWLLPVGDADALAKAMQEASRKYFDAGSLHAEVKSKFGNDAVGQKIAKVYENVLNAKRVRRQA